VLRPDFINIRGPHTRIVAPGPEIVVADAGPSAAVVGPAMKVRRGSDPVVAGDSKQVRLLSVFYTATA
jgi:hypothetical protein